MEVGVEEGIFWLTTPDPHATSSVLVACSQLATVEGPGLVQVKARTLTGQADVAVSMSTAPYSFDELSRSNEAAHIVLSTSADVRVTAAFSGDYETAAPAGRYVIRIDRVDDLEFALRFFPAVPWDEFSATATIAEVVDPERWESIAADRAYDDGVRGLVAHFAGLTPDPPDPVRVTIGESVRSSKQNLDYWLEAAWLEDVDDVVDKHGRQWRAAYSFGPFPWLVSVFVELERSRTAVSYGWSWALARDEDVGAWVARAAACGVVQLSWERDPDDPKLALVQLEHSAVPAGVADDVRDFWSYRVRAYRAIVA